MYSKPSRLFASKQSLSIFASVPLLLSSLSTSHSQVIFEDDFEAPAHTVGAYTSTGAFEIPPGEATIINTDSASGQQSLELIAGAEPNFLFSNFPNIYDSVIFVDMYLKLSAVASAALPDSVSRPLTSLSAFTSEDGLQGELHTVDGDYFGGGAWLSTGITTPLFNNITTDWVRLTWRLDYTQGTYDLYFQEQLIEHSLGFIEYGLSSFFSWPLHSAAATTTGLDFVYAGSVNPLFDDPDSDGIDSAYENAYGMDPQVDDRYQDLDFDALFNIDEYIAGTAANNPDTDNDAVPDAAEILEGNDPLTADVYDLTLPPFYEDFESYPAGALAAGNAGKWQVSVDGSAVISTEEALEGNQSLILQSATKDALLANYADGRTQDRIWVDMHVLPAVAEGMPTIAADTAVAYLFSETGQLIAYDGPQGAGTWVTLDHTPVDLLQSQRLTTHLDYTTQTYSLWLNGVRIAEDLHFAHGSPYFHKLYLENKSEHTSKFDQISIGATEPAELDNDGDGIINSLEDVNQNSLVDIGETDPNNVDTDGDGIIDQPNLRLRLWLKADSGVTTDATGQVTVWNDLSGYGNNAAQADTSAQPQLATSELIGDQPVVRFDGANDYLEGLSEFDASAGDFTLFVVHQRIGGDKKASPLSYSHSSSAKGAPLVRWGPAQNHMGIDSVGIGSNEDGVYIDAGDDFETRMYVTCIRRSGGTTGGLNATLELRAYGSLQTISSTGTQTWTSEPTSGYFIGKRRPNSSHFLEGDVAEILVYDGALSEDQVTVIEGYLSGKYQIVNDYDNDLLGDYWEVTHFGNLLSDPYADADGDQLLNIQEYNLGYDPNVTDHPGGLLNDSSLKLWYHASFGVKLDENGLVSGWRDATGFGNDTWQIFPSDRPTYVTDVLNTQPAVRFSGTGQHLEGNTAVDVSAGDFTIIAVHKATAANSKAGVLSFRTNNDQEGAPNIKWQGGKKIGLSRNGAEVEGEDDDSTKRVMTNLKDDAPENYWISTIRRTANHDTENVIPGPNGYNSLVQVRTNGNQGLFEKEDIQGWHSNATDGFFIGKNKKNTSHFLSGDVAEILIFNEALDEYSLLKLEEQLIAKYGISHDHDEDGFWNIEEDANGNGLVDAGETDPYVADSDGNGITDPYDFQVNYGPGPVDPANTVELTNNTNGEIDFFHGFENSEGTTKTALQGQLGWEGSATVDITGKDAYASNRSVRLKGYSDNYPARVHASLNLTGDDRLAHPQLWVSFYAKLKTGRLPISATLGDTAAIRFTLDEAGNLAAYDSAQDKWLLTDFSIESETWQRYDVYLDYVNKKWDLFHNGLYVFQDLPFIDDTLETLNRFRVFHEGKSDDTPSYIDALSISSIEPAGLDFDGDSLDNATERLIGTDVLNIDTDGDGLGDGFEYTYSLNPLDATDNTGNIDGDFLTDLEEYQLGFNPTLADTDGDGTEDGYAMPGLVLREIWTGMTQKNVNSMTIDTRYPYAPTSRTFLNLLRTETFAEKYGQRVRGFIVPSVTGEYTFAIAGDDASELWLSSDENNFNKQEIASIPVNNWTEITQWYKFESQISEPIPLVAGQKYYIEILHTEWLGVDHFNIAWIQPDRFEFETITSEYLVSYAPNPDDQDLDDLLDNWEVSYGLDATSAFFEQGYYGDLDGDGVNNGTEFLYSSQPDSSDTDGDTINDWEEIYILGSSPLLADSSGISRDLAPWSLELIGGVDLDNISAFLDIEDNDYVLGAKTSDLEYGVDDVLFLNQAIEGDGEIVVRLKSYGFDAISPRIGLMIRDDLSDDSPFVSISSTTNASRLLHHERLATGSEIHESEILGLLDTTYPDAWYKLVKRGNRVLLYFSSNNHNWFYVSESTFISDGVNYIGVFISSNSSDLWVKGRVHIEHLLQDRDGDGIFDIDEISLGSNADSTDTDGDGIDDYEEIRIAYTDPLTDQFGGAPQNILTIPGSSYTNSTGRWEKRFDSALALGFNGELEYNFNLQDADVYRILLNASHHNADRERTFLLELFIDGKSLGKRKQYLSELAKDFVFYSRLLAEGEHTLRLKWYNSNVDLNLFVHSIKFQALPGADVDGNQIKDWIDYRIQSSYVVNESTVATKISPYCLEGSADNLDLLSIDTLLSNSVIRPEQPLVSLNGKWYANIALEAAAPIDFEVRGESNQLVGTGSIVWEEFNLMGETEISLRKGDSLKLVANDANCTTCTAATVTLWTADLLTQVDTFSLLTTDALPYTFEVPGEYIMRTELGGLSHDVAITVISFETESPFYIGSNSRRFWYPDSDEDTYFETEPHLSLEKFEYEDGENYYSEYEMRITELNTAHVVTRLVSNNSIINVMEVLPVDYGRTGETYFEFVEYLPDGSRVYKVNVFLGDLSDGDLSLNVNIFVGGVVFDDGTRNKTLTATDFDDEGVASLLMILGPDVQTSFCHRLSLYHGDELIGF